MEKIVTSDFLGIRFAECEIKGKVYSFMQPSLQLLHKVGEALGGLGEARDVCSLLQTAENGVDGVVNALSVLIQGDNGLYDELHDAPMEEIAKAFEEAYTFIDPVHYMKVAALSKNINHLVARPR